MKKPTKPQLYAEVSRLKSELEQSREEVSRLQAEVSKLKEELEASKAEVSRLKRILGLVWQSRRAARYWLASAREEAGQLMASLLRRL